MHHKEENKNKFMKFMIIKKIVLFLMAIILLVFIYLGQVHYPSKMYQVQQSNLNLNSELASIGLQKIQASCQAVASQRLQQILAETEDTSEITEEVINQSLNSLFTECLTLEGFVFPQVENTENTEEKAQ